MISEHPEALQSPPHHLPQRCVRKGPQVVMKQLQLHSQQPKEHPYCIQIREMKLYVASILYVLSYIVASFELHSVKKCN